MNELHLERIMSELAVGLVKIHRETADLFENIGARLEQSANTVAAARDSSAELAEFVQRLSPDSSALVAAAIARASVEGRALARAELREATGLAEEQLNGATGDLGRKYAYSFGRDVANPFRGKPAGADHLYAIPNALATAILSLTERDTQ